MCSEFNMQKIVAVSMETKKKGGLYNFFYDFSKHDETSLKDSLQGLTTVSILFGKLLQTIDTIFNLGIILSLWESFITLFTIQ